MSTGDSPRPESAAFPHHEDYLPTGPFYPIADIWPFAERQLRLFDMAVEKANRKLPSGPLPDALACWWRRQWASAVLSHTAPPDTVADVRALYSFAVTLDRVLGLSGPAAVQQPGEVEFTYYDRPLLRVDGRGGVERPCFLAQVDREQERAGGYTPSAFPGMETADGRYADERAPELNALLGWRLVTGEFLPWAGFLCEDGHLTGPQYDRLARVGYSTRGVEEWCLDVDGHDMLCQKIARWVLDRLQFGIELAADESRTPAVVIRQGGQFRDSLRDVLRWVEEAEAAGRTQPADTPVERHRRRLERERATLGDDQTRNESGHRAANWRSGVAVLDSFLAPLFDGRGMNPAEVTLALKRVGLMLTEIDAHNPPAADQPRIRRDDPAVWNPAAGVVARLRAFDEVEADFGDPGLDVVLAAGLLVAAVDCDLPRLQEQVEFLWSADGGSALGWVPHLLERLDPFDRDREPRVPLERTPGGWRAVPPGACDPDRRRIDQILLGQDLGWDRDLFPSLREPMAVLDIHPVSDEGAGGEENEAPPGPPPAVWVPRCEGALLCSPDCGEVRRGADTFTFSGNERAVIVYMIDGWESGRRAWNNSDLLDQADSSGRRVRDVFKKGERVNPAWNDLIVRADNKGQYTLRIA